ncbi:hypothetical protein E2C01_059764 [Portunus trituberculatus]|uniref:Uncharacterized protein n=1 Tax=Portunus trituberculatus TaxID=210409 RepID=A0A5B7H6Q9_PORTR|nr:hypothetical protein [Portunus trituberculatus]
MKVMTNINVMRRSSTKGVLGVAAWRDSTYVNLSVVGAGKVMRESATSPSDKLPRNRTKLTTSETQTKCCVQNQLDLKIPPLSWSKTDTQGPGSQGKHWPTGELMYLPCPGAQVRVVTLPSTLRHVTLAHYPHPSRRMTPQARMGKRKS